MTQEQASLAYAFFQTHKDLFQYEKYVGNQDPFETDSTVKSFLDQYREVDQYRQTVPALSDFHFSLLHPSPRTYPMGNLLLNSIPMVQQPKFATLQSTASILENCKLPSRPVPLPLRAIKTMHQDTQLQHHPSPNHTPVSGAKADVSNRFDLLQQRSPLRLSVELKPKKTLSLPKLNILLVDRETRAATTTHNTWDAARKIEVLVGSKCVGRVGATSRNLPPSIRSRLLSSANVSIRRERLYNLLRRDYEMMSKSCT